jgi:hypothetical protein
MLSFWTKFNIDSIKILKEYKSDSFRSICFKLNGLEDNDFIVRENNMYGYFKNENELYKIYQPFNSTRKFLKISDYVQGTEQLVGYKNLVITSSLKDIMAIKSLNLKIDIIAPDSENSILSNQIITKYKEQYKNIVVLFDNDSAGIKSMKKYKELYNITPVLLNMK